ncbi:n1-acetylpolyamine oxidase [Colletotrichum asianum]
MLFGHLRELIDASMSKTHIWGQVPRFECLPAFGQDLCSQIALASQLFATDYTFTGTAVLEKAFTYIGQVAQEEDIFIYGQLFIDIPFILLDYQQHHILQRYLSHLYGVLDTSEKRCHPITQMALLMQQITNEDDDKVLGGIERLHYIAADRYDAIHHAINFNSIERRMEAVLFNGANGQSQSDCDRVLASFETVLEEAIEERREVSKTTISMNVWRIEASRRLKTVDSAGFIARCQKFLQQVFSAAERQNSLTEWSPWLLWKLGEVHYELSRFYIDEGHHEAGLQELEYVSIGISWFSTGWILER